MENSVNIDTSKKPFSDNQCFGKILMKRNINAIVQLIKVTDNDNESAVMQLVRITDRLTESSSFPVNVVALTSYGQLLLSRCPLLDGWSVHA